MLMGQVMQAKGKEKMCRTRDVAFRGVLYGLIAGAVSGPVVVIAWMFSLDYLYPDTQFMATGLEVPGSLIVGAILGAIEGLLVGLLWAIRPRRLTLWWLMVAVAIFALTLGLFKFNPVLGLFALTVPLTMAVLMRIVALFPSTAQSGGRMRIGSDPEPLASARNGTEPELNPGSIAWLYERRIRWQKPPETGREPETRNGNAEE
jgi:hypothetical protein